MSNVRPQVNIRAARPNWMRRALALSAAAVILFLLAFALASAVLAFLGGAAMSIAYLAALYAMYRSREPLPMRDGGLLTADDRPGAYRFWYAFMSIFGWAGLLVCAAGVLQSLLHVA